MNGRQLPTYAIANWIRPMAVKKAVNMALAETGMLKQSVCGVFASL